MKIIPAIDIIDGKCVRLTEGDYSTSKIYSENPLEIAKKFEASGVQYLHLVDLDGAKEGRIVNDKILNAIATETTLNVDFGGGIRTDEDAHIAFESGASQITGGSIAIKKPEIFLNWLHTYGADKIILGADCKNRHIATDGWLNTSSMDVVQFIQEYQQKGITNVTCTDIAKDGMLQGPSLLLYQEIIAGCDVSLIASGGVSSIEDVRELESLGCSGVIIGKALYENKISLKELEALC